LGNGLFEHPIAVWQSFVIKLLMINQVAHYNGRNFFLLVFSHFASPHFYILITLKNHANN